jgi:hypothetical protein
MKKEGEHQSIQESIFGLLTDAGYDPSSSMHGEDGAKM